MGLVVLSDREGLTWIRYGFVVVPSLLAIWFGLSGRIDVRRLGAIAVLFVASMIFLGHLRAGRRDHCAVCAIN